MVEATIGTVTLDAAQLTMLLDGVDLDRVTRARVWSPPKRTASAANEGIDKTDEA